MTNQSPLLHVLVAVFIVTLIVSGLVHPRSKGAKPDAEPQEQAAAEATPTPLAHIQGPPTSCAEPGAAADVTFTWQPMPGATAQFLDVSLLDDEFQKPAARTVGPLDPSVDTFTWTGLQDNQSWRWRVNSMTKEGWFFPSPTRIITPCGANELASASRCEGTPAVEFRWRPSSGALYSQWLDVSTFDNGFAPGTYRSVGPLDHGINSLTWEQLPGSALVWRVNTNTPKGWVATEVHSIATCDVPVGLQPHYSCANGRAVVQFRWSPVASTTAGQWIDLSLVLDGFQEGNFKSSGKIPPTGETQIWPDLAPNQPHYYRVNALTPNGWRTSVTRSFIPICPPS